MMGFTVFFYIVFFFNKEGVPAGGRWLVTKRRYMRLLGLGVWGRGGVNMRLLGVETSLKETENTTRTSTIITLQQQKHSKNECNQTNKQTKIKETRSKERNKQTHKQPTKTQTNK